VIFAADQPVASRLKELLIYRPSFLEAVFFIPSAGMFAVNPRKKFFS
jgi:hypothetical protein